MLGGKLYRLTQSLAGQLPAGARRPSCTDLPSLQQGPETVSSPLTYSSALLAWHIAEVLMTTTTTTECWKEKSSANTV